MMAGDDAKSLPDVADGIVATEKATHASPDEENS
jgi:hypothetical protein